MVRSMRPHTNISRITRLEDYFTGYEVEILKQYGQNKGDPTLDDLWNQFITAATLIHGEKVNDKMELIKMIDNIVTNKFRKEYTDD